MKIHKTEVKEKSETIIQDIVCNICGEKIQKNEFGYYEDYINIEKSWGYHSGFDGETHCIDICQDCYIDLVKSMKIKPEYIKP